MTPTLELNNGVTMPVLGSGVFRRPPAAILDTSRRGSRDPNTITSEAFGHEVPEA
ncbi:MAG TPA: hypothetical protein VGL78_18665 [Solirubrobacteraceae bacterium]|jgi:hypothetical protein